MYEVLISSQAERDLRKLPRQIVERVTPEMQKLAANPRPNGCVKLAGTKSDYRIRLGDYRVLYEIADQVRIVPRAAPQGRVSLTKVD